MNGTRTWKGREPGALEEVSDRELLCRLWRHLEFLDEAGDAVENTSLAQSVWIVDGENLEVLTIADEIQKRAESRKE